MMLFNLNNSQNSIKQIANEGRSVSVIVTIECGDQFKLLVSSFLKIPRDISPKRKSLA